MKWMVLPFLCANISLFAQPLQVETLQFEDLSTVLTDAVKHQISDARDRVSGATVLELVLITKRERYGLGLSLADKNTLADARSIPVIAYLENCPDVDPKSIEWKNRPFDQPRQANEQHHYVKSSHRMYSVLLHPSGNRLKEYTGNPATVALANVPEQIYSASCQEEAIVECRQGVTIVVPSNTFVRLNGTTPSCCEVQLHIWEFMSTADFLKSELTTSAGKRMLETAGTIYIEATCGTERLTIAPGKTIQVLFPVRDPEKRMQLFKGSPDKNIIDWQASGPLVSPNLSEEDLEEFEWEEGGELDYLDWGEYAYKVAALDKYVLKSSALGWINCDRFPASQAPAQLIARVDSSYRMVVRMIFQDISSILPGYYYTTKRNCVRFDGLPKGQDVTVIAYGISKDTQQARFARVDFTLGQTEEIDLKPQLVSEKELESLLHSL